MHFAPGGEQNKGSAPSSRRRQRSSALHLDGFESVIVHHENTVIVIPQLRCFQLYSPSASYIGCASYICFASDIGLRPVLEANII